MEEDKGTVLFDRGNNQLTHEEIWDDTLLIKQYEETIDKARNALAQKLNSVSSATDSEISQDRHLKVQTHTSPVTKSFPTSHVKKKKKKKSRKKNEWHTGDPCRAHYTEDGELYEATIISINNDERTCTVRYIGYDNYEAVALSSLLKSRGDGARRKQMSDVIGNYTQTDDTADGSSAIDSDIAATESDRDRNRHSHSAKHDIPPMSHFPSLPPPPALGLIDDGHPVSSEALHTMLMSWYMTGYHTGYYQGLTQARHTFPIPKQHNRNK